MPALRRKIYLSPPHLDVNELKMIHEALQSNWIAPLGPHVDRFEQEIAASVGAKGAVALSSGTAAIHLALRLAGVQPNDKVLCSTLTFVASANPILYERAVPVFIDSEPDSWNMCPSALARACADLERRGELPKAAVVVDLYGQSANMTEITRICSHYGIVVIEDAAEALGALHSGKACGTLGDFGIYSFNGNKIITTSGGGMLVSDDTEALERARFWALQARDPARHYEHSQLGFNYRLSNLLASVGRGQLVNLDRKVMLRRQIFQRYVDRLSHLPGVSFMPETIGDRSTRWLTALTVDQAEANVSNIDLLNALERVDIEARPVWKPLHRQPLFDGYAYYPYSEEQSVSDELFSQGICLPSGSGLTEEEQNEVIDTILEVFEKGNQAFRQKGDWR
ncbi:DegT/DnrJ/EryC1/StrS family aminotransferase [Cohnella yongneupensis]|uniref:DegT/DnrJ/EryC1/StrS family aminotransferase n=1 Tax=Cohnella yongneupensis TaxID=425006 RepID=A0ABW0R6U8_9BACL